MKDTIALVIAWGFAFTAIVVIPVGLATAFYLWVHRD